MSGKTNVTNGIIIKERRILRRTNKPVKLPDNATWLKQPNLITLMSCDLSVLQMRAVITIIDSLQKEINESIKGKPFEQLSLFKSADFDTQIIKLVIPLKNFQTSPNHYPRLRQAIKDLTRIPVELDVEHPDTGQATFNTTLLSAVIPLEGSTRRNVIFRIDKEVAKCLVSVDASKYSGYTSYIKEVAFKSQSKYTIRMYLLISSWKSRSGFSKNVDALRSWLRLSDKMTWKDVEKRVLNKAEEELHENADCWFHYSPVYDPNISMSEPIRIDVKVIKSVSDEDKLLVESAKASVRNILYHNFKIPLNETNKITDKIDLYNRARVLDKLMFLGQYINANIKDIKDVNKYVITSFDALFEELGETDEAFLID